jgi:hypothetical protein
MKITKESKLGYDKTSLLVDGKRWFPMMGEMHFSRYPRERWEEELCKMKSGGIDIVSLYVIWIHHEEVKGEFDFTGDRDLKTFLETVKKCGMYSILRIGPWAHGEARNGGFPDWLLEDAKARNYEVRTDAPEYLEHARRFYEKIYEQAQGFFIKDDGPIIGVQIENEYGHCGGKNGQEGETHMKTLQNMAKEIGFVVPIYTATGWGGAVTGGMLPVMGGYCEAPWDPRFTEIEPSGNYIFTRERNDHNIGSDHGLGAGITFDMDKFPFLTAELGGGVQVTHHRRPIATGLDTAAMTMTKMGCGANLLGYYMYHGGTNPKGKLTTLQESTATGYPNDLPEYAYDFNAPLREFGQMEDTYREVRLIASFIHDFGNEMCDMEYTGQPGNPLKPENLTDLRTSVRYKKVKDSRGNEVNSGYLFVNNYQRRYEMAAHDMEVLNAYGEDGKTVLASFAGRKIENGDFFFYPFGLPVGNRAFITVDATPMCIVHDVDGNGHDAYVFYTDSDREINADIKGDLDGNRILVLDRDEAVHASKVVIGGKEYLIISDSEPVTCSDGSVELFTQVKDTKKPAFRAYPALVNTPESFETKSGALDKGEFLSSDVLYTYESRTEYRNEVYAEYTEISEKDGIRTFEVKTKNVPDKASEVFMNVDFTGDIARLYYENDIKTDTFYTGQVWEIGLKRYTDGDFFGEISITPLLEEYKEKMYLQKWPEMENKRACRINGIDFIAQYRIKIS